MAQPWCLHTSPQPALPNLHDLQPHHHEEVSLVCACTEADGTGIGAVCVNAVDKNVAEKDVESHKR